MKRKIFTLSAIALMAFSNLSAAEINVASGSDLQAAIDNASSGDVLILDDGGVYDKNATLIFDAGKELTIKVTDGAAQKAEVITDGIRFGETATSGIIAQGIIFDGSFSGDYFIKADQAGDGAKYVKLENCEIHSYKFGLLGMWGEPECFIDTLVFNNCYLHDLNSDGGWMNQFLSFGDRARIKYYQFSNSTIDGYNELFIDYSAPAYVTRMVIDHCTINGKIGEKDERFIFGMNAAEGSSFKLSNSIISNIDPGVGSGLFKIAPTVADTIMNCIYYGLDATISTDNEWNSSSKFEQMDPQFVAPFNYDLTLSDGSPALTYGTDGGYIGDPRWAGVNTPVKNITESNIKIFTTSDMIYFSENIKSVSVISLTGALVKIGVNTNQMNIGNLSTGIYVVNIQDFNGATKSMKVIH